MHGLYIAHTIFSISCIFGLSEPDSLCACVFVCMCVNSVMRGKRQLLGLI